MTNRLVPLEGAYNFRDLGGYVTSDGRTIKHGKVFRSDGLSLLTDDDHLILLDIGLRSIVDLRYETEREDAPSRLPPTAEIKLLPCPIGTDAGQPDTLTLILQGKVDEIDLDFMIAIYREMLSGYPSAFASALTHLAEPAHLPAVFHCAAGKDRTGLTAAFLLELLGVDRETILDDYELSTEYRTTRRVEELRPQIEAVGVDVERVRIYLGAPRPVLEAALAWIEEQYGSVLEYLVDQGGLDPATPENLQALLLE